VERSVRTVRENALAQNSTANSAAATVEQNIPNAQGLTEGGKNSNETNDRREELTNYEVSSRTIETAHDGFRIENLSIAVLLNQAQLEEYANKGQDALPVEHQLMEIEQLVTAAAGLNRDRGDQLKVASAAFVENAPPEIADPGIVSTLMAQFGAIFNGLALIVVAIVAILFGLRPAINAIVARAPAGSQAPALMIADAEPTLALAVPSGGGGGGGGLAVPSAPGLAMPGMAIHPGSVNLIEDVTQRINRSPQKRLEQIVEYDEAQAAAILRQWLRQDEATA
jgi:flagellar M-ring protein FliF